MIAGPTFCWWCLGDLLPGARGPIFTLVKDPIGNVHRVHHACLSFAAADGNEPLEAARPEAPPLPVRIRMGRRARDLRLEKLGALFENDEAERYAVHYVDGDARADE